MAHPANKLYAQPFWQDSRPAACDFACDAHKWYLMTVTEWVLKFCSAAAQYGLWHPFMAPLTCNIRVTSPEHFQDTRQIEFDLSGSGIQYAPGDLLTIFPRQSSAALSAFFKRANLVPNAWVKIEAADASNIQCSPMQVVYITYA